MNTKQNKSIALIGPMCAGKSTIAEWLSKKLNMPRCEVDELRWVYYKQTGYSEEEARRIFQQEGNLGVLKYSKPFEAEVVQLILKDHTDSVIDFGAGQSVYEDKADFERVEAALSPIKNVILLLPEPDASKSIQTLNKRFRSLLEGEGIEATEELLALNEHFVHHPSNRKLAKKIVYTKGKSVEETAQEILEWVAR